MIESKNPKIIEKPKLVLQIMKSAIKKQRKISKTTQNLACELSKAPTPVIQSHDRRPKTREIYDFWSKKI